MKNSGHFLLEKRLQVLDREERCMSSEIKRSRRKQIGLVNGSSEMGYVGANKRKRRSSGGRTAAPRLANYLSTGSFVPAGGRNHRSSPIQRNRRIFIGILVGMVVFIAASVLKRL